MKNGIFKKAIRKIFFEKKQKTTKKKQKNECIKKKFPFLCLRPREVTLQIPLFNGMSTFVCSFKAKSLPVKEQ